MRNLAVQAKAITGGLLTAIATAATLVTALNVHAAWVPALIAAATALGVYGGVHRVPNRPGSFTSADVPGGLVKFTGDVSPEVAAAVKKSFDALHRREPPPSVSGLKAPPVAPEPPPASGSKP